MDVDSALNAASKLKERFFMTDREAILAWQIIERETNANELLKLVVKIAAARERDWGYERGQQEMTAQARELLKSMNIEWKV